MKNFKKVLVVLLTIAVIGCMAFSLSACGEKKKKADAEVPTLNWSENDAYTLELKDGKVVSNVDYVITMEKEKGKDFVVLNLADIQLSDGDWYVQSSAKRIALKTIRALIDEVEPDLITLTGDQDYGEEYCLKKWIKLLDSFEIPWAPVYGNHDNQENDCTIAYQAKLYSESKYCIFQYGPTNLGKNSNGHDAIGHYVVNVVEKDDSENGFYVTNSLIFMNTRDGQSYDDPKYQTPEMKAACLGNGYASWTEEQIAWYKWAANGVQKYGKDGYVQSTITQHIPNYDYETAFRAAYKSDLDPYDPDQRSEYEKESLKADLDKSYTAEYWNEGYEGSFGVRHELGGISPYPDGVHDAFKECHTTLVISGHDHVNNYVINYEGVTYAYALKTGPGCYWEKELSGGSVYTINDNGDTSIEHIYVSKKGEISRKTNTK